MISPLPFAGPVGAVRVGLIEGELRVNPSMPDMLESDLDLIVCGTPEGVLSAAAIRSVGGRIIGRLWPRSDEERAAIIAAGLDVDRVLDVDDLVASQDALFAATGVSDGDLVHGVRFGAAQVETQTIVLRGHCRTRDDRLGALVELAAYGPSPAPPVVLVGGDAGLADALRDVLGTLHEDAAGRAALDRARMLRLDPVTDADYQPTRDCDRRAAPFTP